MLFLRFFSVALTRFWVTILQVNVKGQGPLPSPSCPPWGRNKPGQCNLQFVDTCDCPTDAAWCDHDGECPGCMYLFIQILTILP